MDQNRCPFCLSPLDGEGPCPSCGRLAAEYTPATYHLPPGTTLLGRYVLGRVLGEGGFGITYSGWDRQLDVRVAIKEYFPKDKATRVSENDPQIIRYNGADQLFQHGCEQFLLEARAMARLGKLQGIVGAGEFFQENGTAYIVMEYVEGLTLKELPITYSGRVPAGVLLPLVEPLMDDLEAMHKTGLIHRDISPENLMLENGVLRLLDLGCAREPGDGTATMTVMLKQDYAPLEQYLDRVQGPWTDVYSLCATLYYCLTGHALPPAIERLAGEKLIPPRELGADLSPAQEQALLRGLGLQPRRRYQSIAQLRKALYKGPAPSAQEASAPSLKKYRRFLWMGAAAAVLLAFLMVPRLWPSASPAPPVSSDASGSQVESGTPTPSGPPESSGLAEAATTPEPETSPASEASPVRPAPQTSLPDAGTPVELTVFNGSTEEELRALLSDSAVDGVALPDGCRLLLGPLELQKPLRILPGAALALTGEANVSGAGALEVGGELRIEMLLHLREGGALRVENGGAVAANGICWVDGGALSIEEGGMADSLWEEGHLLEIDEAELFQNATHVQDYAGYRQALLDGSSAIVVDEDMVIPGFGENHDVPVLISEGVSVTPVFDHEGTGACQWGCSNTVLINRGSLQAELCMWDSPVLLNYGSISGHLRMNGGVLVNLGEASLRSVNGSGGLYCNVGSLDHPRGERSGDWQVPAGCALLNSGDFYAEGRDDGPSTVVIQQGARLFNSGTLRLGKSGWLMNEAGATVLSTGRLLVENQGQLINYGEYRNAGGTAEYPGDGLTGSPPENGSYW